MPNLVLTMSYRFYSIISIFIIHVVMFNWHNQHAVFSVGIILWSLVPLFSLHYIIKHYECFHNNTIITIRSYSAWVLFFAWITCICFSITMPYAINIMADTNSHYISLYILSPAVTLFFATMMALFTSLIMLIITRLIR